MNISGKKLLVLTGCNGDKDIIAYANKLGVYTIATDYYKKSIVKKAANEYHTISTTDLAGIYNLSVKLKVDGIVTGASLASMNTIQSITSMLGLPFYATKEQLDIINDKALFKKFLALNNVNVPAEVVDYDNIDFPVIVKPVDSSSHKGISVCSNREELANGVIHAKDHSDSGNVIVEKYIKGVCEVFANYTLVDGRVSISCLFDNLKTSFGHGLADVNMCNYYSSAYVDEFMVKVHPRLIKAFEAANLCNGIIAVQTIYDGTEFYVYEGGYRIGGTQSYLFCNYVNGIDSLGMMVNYSLTGNMTDDPDVLERDTPYFRRSCCQLNIPLLGGVIGSIDGIDLISSYMEVINVTKVKDIGDTIIGQGTMNEVCMRLHIVANTDEMLLSIVKRILLVIHVTDIDGTDMLLPGFKYKCITALEKQMMLKRRRFIG